MRMRSMARRTAEDQKLALSPRTRTIAGWLAALGLLAVIAFFVGRLGGDAQGPTADPGSSPSTSAGISSDAIAFGTALDATSGAVSEASRTTRFTAGDTFAYSILPDPPSSEPQIYVEVERTGGGAAETVQEPTEAQGVPPEAAVIAFQVPADRLLADFGAGDYVMRIYFELEGEVVADGEFQLIGPSPSPTQS